MAEQSPSRCRHGVARRRPDLRQRMPVSDTTNASPAENADDIDAAAGAGPAVAPDVDDEFDEAELGSESDEDEDAEDEEAEDEEEDEEEEESGPTENDLFRESEIA